MLEPPLAARTPLAAEWSSWEAGENPFAEILPMGQRRPSLISLPIYEPRRDGQDDGALDSEDTYLDEMNRGSLIHKSINDISGVSVKSLVDPD